MMTEEEDLKDNSEFEISGYLQKKTTKGFYVNRYFSTFGHTLRYWQDQVAFDNSDKSSEVYDICDIKNIEKTNNRQFNLYFLNERFKLELKAASDEQCKEWTEVLMAKRSMYSVDELLITLDTTRMSFKTKTFRSLLVLKEKDQNKFILDRLDDIFTAPSREMQSGKNVIESSALIKAARVTIEELLTNCEECMLEMAQRNPQVTVHCRTYIRRYAEIVKGRLTLELLFLPGTQDKRYENMGEKSICAAIELMTRVDQLTHYSFIPHDLVATLNNTLFTTGQLISSLLNLAIQRVDAFVETVKQMAPSLRSSKYLEIDKILSESMLLVEITLPENALLKLVLIKLVTSQMLCFTDHLTEVDFANYEESALIFHVNTCDILLQRFKVSYIALETRKMVHKVKREMDITNDNEYLLFPPAVTDALNSACFISSRNAVLCAVHNMTESVGDLTAGLLHERVVGWIGGDLCSAFIVRLDQWVMNLSTILPTKYSAVLFIEVGRLMVKLYVSNMIESYHSNKSLKLSSRGVEQLQSDLRAVHMWLTAHIPEDGAMDEKDLLLTLCEFITCPHEAALQNYARAVQKFGIQYALHLYDIIRLVMKFRIDFSPKVRKAVLGLCGEYLHQLQKAAASDSDLLSGSNTRGSQYFDTSILEILCPRVGVEHCTGKKWSVETLADPLPVRLTVAMLVTSTCTESRSAKNRSAKSSFSVQEPELRLSDASEDHEAHIKADAEELPETKIVYSVSPKNTTLLRAMSSEAQSSASQLKKVTVFKKPKALPVPLVARDLPPTPSSPVVMENPVSLSSHGGSNPWGDTEGDSPISDANPNDFMSQSAYSMSSVSDGGLSSNRNSVAIPIRSRYASEDDVQETVIPTTFSESDLCLAVDVRSIHLDKFDSTHSAHISFPVEDDEDEDAHTVHTIDLDHPILDLDHRPLPKTPPPPPVSTTTRPVSSMNTGARAHTNSVRFNIEEINSQNAARAGLKGRPLPPPPIRVSPEPLMELLPIDQERPTDIIVGVSSEVRPQNVVPVRIAVPSVKPAPPAKPMKRPSLVPVGSDTNASPTAVDNATVDNRISPTQVKVSPAVQVSPTVAGRRPPIASPESQETKVITVENADKPPAPQSPKRSLAPPLQAPVEDPLKEEEETESEKVLSPKEAFQLLLNKAKQDAASSIKSAGPPKK